MGGGYCLVIDLLSAIPGTTSITRVAQNYGFSHVEKFAIEYRRSFGESPSVTLLKVSIRLDSDIHHYSHNPKAHYQHLNPVTTKL